MMMEMIVGDWGSNLGDTMGPSDDEDDDDDGLNLR